MHTNAETHRVFTAIELPSGIPEKVTHLASLVANDVQELLWTPSEKLHLTLTFLGNLEPKTITALASSLNELHAPRTVVSTRGVEYFAGSGAIVLDVEPTPTLLAVQSAVKLAGTQIGLRPELRSYHPHITIARKRRMTAKSEHRHDGPFIPNDSWEPPRNRAARAHKLCC